MSDKGQPSKPATFLRTPLFETNDPYEASDYLKAAYGDHGAKVSGSEADFAFRASTMVVGDLAFGWIHHTMGCRSDVQDGIPLPTIIQQAGPHPFRVTSAHRDDTTKDGSSMSVAQHVPYTVGLCELRSTVPSDDATSQLLAVPRAVAD